MIGGKLLRKTTHGETDDAVDGRRDARNRIPALEKAMRSGYLVKHFLIHCCLKEE